MVRWLSREEWDRARAAEVRAATAVPSPQRIGELIVSDELAAIVADAVRAQRAYDELCAEWDAANEVVARCQNEKDALRLRLEAALNRFNRYIAEQAKQGTFEGMF